MSSRVARYVAEFNADFVSRYGLSDVIQQGLDLDEAFGVVRLYAIIRDRRAGSSKVTITEAGFISLTHDAFDCKVFLADALRISEEQAEARLRKAHIIDDTGDFLP